MTWLPALGLAVWTTLLICWTRGLLIQIARNIYDGIWEIMAKVAIEQDTLNEIAAEVSETADLLQSVLDSETPLEDADVTAITAAVAKLKGVGVKVPTEPTGPVQPSEPSDPEVNGDEPVVSPGE